jgi:hypothetical protein
MLSPFTLKIKRLAPKNSTNGDSGIGEAMEEFRPPMNADRRGLQNKRLIGLKLRSSAAQKANPQAC